MTDYLRGYEIWFNEQTKAWHFKDTGEPTAETYHNRPCGFCKLSSTPEGHDGCLGTLESVRNACCGHGQVEDAYIQFEDESRISGVQVMKWIEKKKKIQWLKNQN